MANSKNLLTKTFSHVTTTSGISAPAWTITMPDNVVWAVSLVCVARDRAGVERAMYRRFMLAYRQGGGVATQQGTTETVGTDIETNASLSVSLGVDGANDIGSGVTGLAATTIDWSFFVQILEAKA